MILVDTCVIINYLRTPTPEIKKIFQKNEIAICGVVMAELLRGAVSEKQFNQLKSSLECFEYIPFEQEDWDSLPAMDNRPALFSTAICAPRAQTIYTRKIKTAPFHSNNTPLLITHKKKST